MPSLKHCAPAFRLARSASTELTDFQGSPNA